MKLGASFDFFFMGFVGFWNLLMEMIGLESLRIKLKQGGEKIWNMLWFFLLDG